MDFTSYEIWHDEYHCSATGAYVHGILLLPHERKDEIVDYLRLLREEFNELYTAKRGFAGSLKTEKRARFLRHQLALGTHFLSTKEQAPLPLVNADPGMRDRGDYSPFLEVPGDVPFDVKLGVLVVPENHADMFGADYSVKVETTLRFAIKGLCHWAFNKEKPIEVQAIYFDGTEHHGRDYYLHRIIGRENWASHVRFIPGEVTIDSRHRNERTDETAPIMDLIDAMLGGLYNAIYLNPQDPYQALAPLSELKERLEDGRVQYQRNSRWFKAVSLSEVYTINDERISFAFTPLDQQQSPEQGTLGF
jgi:hypothetical protein